MYNYLFENSNKKFVSVALVMSRRPTSVTVILPASNVIYDKMTL